MKSLMSLTSAIPSSAGSSAGKFIGAAYSIGPFIFSGFVMTGSSAFSAVPTPKTTAPGCSAPPVLAMSIPGRIISRRQFVSCARSWGWLYCRRHYLRSTTPHGTPSSATSSYVLMCYAETIRPLWRPLKWTQSYGALLRRSRSGLGWTPRSSPPRCPICCVGRASVVPWGYRRNGLNYPQGGEIEGCV